MKHTPQGFKIRNKYFSLPLLIQYAFDEKNFGVWKSDRLAGDFAIRFWISRSGGTTEHTNLWIEYKIGERQHQWSFCWRPQVTWYYWNRESFFKWRKAQYEKWKSQNEKKKCP